ncbi:MAG: FAD-binding oxidoreductase [Beijerinckiaceae bacterium]|nr:FAD-binding oxidoreductase [Beijerinckiaceae bacterium]
MAEPFPLAPALWAATATPALPTPALADDVEIDFCVIGGGYAGLSTALHIAEAGGHVIVLEAREPGWGGSGRNGGQVIPGLKYDPDDMIATYGEEKGHKLLQFAATTADKVFDLIAKYEMDVPHVREGWIQAAHSDEGLALAKKRVTQWSKHGVAARLLSKEETADRLGTTSYEGGWLDPRGGAIQPLSYARGLARAAVSQGARIHGETAVTDITREGERFRVSTAQGKTVRAKKVIMCTNAYAGDLVPGLRQTFVDVNSFQVATAPLSDNIRKTILPYGQVSSDTRKLLLYFRLDHTGRLLMGGRGPFREPNSEDDWAHLVRVVTKMFPQVKDVPINYRWGGRVALTQDFLPHIHEPEQGFIIDVGCLGRGVGLQTAMGQALAGYAMSGNADLLPFPIRPIDPIPFHMFRRVGLAAIIAWYRFQDGGVKQT